MTPSYLLILLLLLSTIAYYLGKTRAFAVVKQKGGPRVLHSRPGYYGMLTALWCGIPAVLLYFFWLAFESTIISDMILSNLPDKIKALPADRLTLVMNDIKNLVNGNIISGEISPAIKAASEYYEHLQFVSHACLTVIVLIISIAGFLVVLKMIQPGLRARNHVERLIKIILIACSTIAIFTTIGIVMSVLYEAIRFLR